MESVRPKVTIVGAGPGDPELITVKGLKAIKQARVVLHDALTSPDLLMFASTGCKKIYVGKRKGIKEFPQDEINQLIVFYAIKYGKVVRLKGGDPYVFGRGHEELTYVKRRGIEVEVINGVSSALAAPAAAGIPLTKRGINESFWVITGTLSSGEISNDITLAAQSSATVIILMGMSYLSEIALLFQKTRGAEEPIAVIQEATNANQKVAIGNATNITHRVEALHITSPAVIVVGRVVDECQVTDRSFLATVEALRKNA